MPFMYLSQYVSSQFSLNRKRLWFATHAGDMIGEVALAIEMGADAVHIGKSCTDLPPVGK